MLYFLMLQEEMVQNAENQQINSEQNPNMPFFPNMLPEDLIQKVIFDKNYLKYMRDKKRDHSNSAQK